MNQFDLLVMYMFLVCRFEDPDLIKTVFTKVTTMFDTLCNADKDHSRPVFLSTLLLTVQEMHLDDLKKLECFNSVHANC
jgi:hypothetical protein